MPRVLYRFDREHLRQMQDAGMSPNDIAKVYGCERTTIIYWLKKFGLPTTVKVIALTEGQVIEAIERHRRHVRRMPA